MYRRYGKRWLDLALCIPALIVLLPLLAILALANWIALGAPVLFIQERPGLNGRTVRVIKFRTMRTLSSEIGVPLPDAERLTVWGRFLRSTSLDELPELWNVVTGSMSLVGPRPLLMSYLSRYDDTQRRRHEVPPGITGWAQIHGRNAVSWPERLALDVWYVDHVSLRLDLRILVRTISEVLRRSGIQAEGSATMPEFEGGQKSAPETSGETRSRKPLYVYGASGHAKVIVDIAERSGQWTIRGVLDDDTALAGQRFLGYPVLGDRKALYRLNPQASHIVIAIGANKARKRVAAELHARGFRLATLIHPAAVIGRDVTIGEGTVVMAGAIVNPATVIGSLCILNTGCTVDHDGRIGQAVHISPGAHLAGNVSVADECWVGIGSSIIEGKRIGARAIIGAGSVVISDIPDDTTAVGVPARVILTEAARSRLKATSQ